MKAIARWLLPCLLTTPVVASQVPLVLDVMHPASVVDGGLMARVAVADLLSLAAARVDLGDATIVLERVRVTVRAGDDYSWLGRVVGDEQGHALLVVRSGRLTASLQVTGRHFLVRPLADGQHSLSEVDPAGYPSEGEPVLIAPSGPIRRNPVAAIDDGSLIDVLIVYTGAVAAMVADVPAMAQLAIDQTNLAYEMSNIDQRLRLMDLRQVTYTETGNSYTDLFALQDGADGVIDIVHTWRNDCAADAVVMWVEDAEVCGRAYLMDVVDPSFEIGAFGVVRRDCVTAEYSFGHELGHIMGAHHNRENASAGAYPYSFGYRVTGTFRTVMSYACVPACQRVLHFSNPEVSYMGLPTGIPEGDPLAADNRKTLNNTAPTVANFRDSATGCCPNDLFEPDDVCADAGRIGGGETQVRGFCEDASDRVRFLGCAGQSYTIETLALATAADTVLELYGADCATLLATDDNGGPGLASRLDWGAPATDYYHVRVVQKDGTYGKSRSYDLRLTGDTAACAICGDGFCNGAQGEGCSTCTADCTPCEPSGLGTVEALRVVKGSGGIAEVYLENVAGETGYVLYEEAIGNWYAAPSRTCQPAWTDLGARVRMAHAFAPGDRWIVAGAANANGESSCGQAWNGMELNQLPSWPSSAPCP